MYKNTQLSAENWLGVILKLTPFPTLWASFIIQVCTLVAFGRDICVSRPHLQRRFHTYI